MDNLARQAVSREIGQTKVHAGRWGCKVDRIQDDTHKQAAAQVVREAYRSLVRALNAYREYL